MALPLRAERVLKQKPLLFEREGRPEYDPENDSLRTELLQVESNLQPILAILAKEFIRSADERAADFSINLSLAVEDAIDDVRKKVDKLHIQRGRAIEDKDHDDGSNGDGSSAEENAVNGASDGQEAIDPTAEEVAVETKPPDFSEERLALVKHFRESAVEICREHCKPFTQPERAFWKKIVQEKNNEIFDLRRRVEHTLKKLKATATNVASSNLDVPPAVMSATPQPSVGTTASPPQSEHQRSSVKAAGPKPSSVNNAATRDAASLRALQMSRLQSRNFNLLRQLRLLETEVMKATDHDADPPLVATSGDPDDGLDEKDPECPTGSSNTPPLPMNDIPNRSNSLVVAPFTSLRRRRASTLPYQRPVEDGEGMPPLLVEPVEGEDFAAHLERFSEIIQKSTDPVLRRAAPQWISALLRAAPHDDTSAVGERPIAAVSSTAAPHDGEAEQHQQRVNPKKKTPAAELPLRPKDRSPPRHSSHGSKRTPSRQAKGTSHADTAAVPRGQMNATRTEDRDRPVSSTLAEPLAPSALHKSRRKDKASQTPQAATLLSDRATQCSSGTTEARHTMYRPTASVGDGAVPDYLRDVPRASTVMARRAKNRTVVDGSQTLDLRDAQQIVAELNNNNTRHRGLTPLQASAKEKLALPPIESDSDPAARQDSDEQPCHALQEGQHVRYRVQNSSFGVAPPPGAFDGLDVHASTYIARPRTTQPLQSGDDRVLGPQLRQWRRQHKPTPATSAFVTFNEFIKAHPDYLQ